MKMFRQYSLEKAFLYEYFPLTRSFESFQFCYPTWALKDP